MLNAPSDPLIGSSVSQYTIVAKLGGGGMGVVYKATDTKLGRAVALKFLPPQWSHDESAKLRFLREAQAASATNHPNICVIHDIEETEDGRLFIVMAYYEGQTLKQKLEEGPLPLFEALEIAGGVAEGLAKAHAQGVVHRDIKPGNLIVSDEGVRIVDFGLAKFADAVKLTIEGSTIGTVAYMSPEQARGEDADARSDVWALGVVLYEMLTGEVPFKGAYPEAVFYAIKNEPVPPVRVSAGEMTERLEALVLRALEKDQEKRYQAARDLARDLRLLQGRTLPIDLITGPVPGPSHPGPLRPVSGWTRARRAITPVRAGVALGVLLAGSAASYWWLTVPITRIPVAIAPVSNRTLDSGLDAYRLAMTESLVDELGNSPNIRVVSHRRAVEVIRQYVAAGNTSSTEAVQALASNGGARLIVIPTLVYRENDKTWLARADLRDVETGTSVATYETEAVTSVLPKGTAHRLMGSLSRKIQAHFGPGGAIDRVIAVFRLPLGFRQWVNERLYGERPFGTGFQTLDAVQAFEEGQSAYEQLEYSTALAAFRRAAELDGQRAITHAWLSRVLLILNKRNEAVGAAKRATQVAATSTPRGVAAFIGGVLAESQSDAATAERSYRQLAMAQPDDGAGQIELADFLKRQNRDQDAISAYREVLRRDAGYIRPHVDLCQLYTRVDEYPLAGQECQRALEKYKALANRAGEAQGLMALSELQRKRGNLAEAKATAEAAREIFKALGLEYGLSRIYQYLGVVAGYSGDYRTAVQLFEEALLRSRRVGNRAIEAFVLNNLAVGHERLGQKVQALDYYKQGHDLYQENGDEPNAAEQEANAASLLIDYSGDQAAALQRLGNAHATFQRLGRAKSEVFAMEYEAASDLHAGRHGRARAQLQAALNLARDTGYRNRDVSITVKLAESYFATAEYEQAAALLEKAAESEAGRDDREVAVTLGRIDVRLGDFGVARMRLEGALRAIEASGQLSLLPTAHLALGELEYQSGTIQDARRHFEKAGSLWTDAFPDVASVEARCYQGSIDAAEGRASTAPAIVLKSVGQAAMMWRLSTETQCRILLAGIHVGRQDGEAVAVLAPVPLEGDRSVGRELQAKVHYWRSLALAGRGEAARAAAERTEAATLMRDLQGSLSPRHQVGFAARRDIRPVVEDEAVRKPR